MEQTSAAHSVDSFAVHFIDSFARHTFLDSVSFSIFDTLHTFQFVRVQQSLSEAAAHRHDTAVVSKRDTIYVASQRTADRNHRLSWFDFVSIFIIIVLGCILHDVIRRAWD